MTPPLSGRRHSIGLNGQVPPSRRGRRTSAARVGRPPGSNREETIARLVTAAQQHFGERGFSGARMVDIASDAGVTHSSIYQYFSSKDDLYRASFEAAQAELLPDYQAAVATESTMRGRIGAIMRASAEIHKRHPSITPFLASVPVELRRHPELVEGLRDLGEPILHAMNWIFDDARENGEISGNLSNDDLLVAFIGSAMGIGLLSYGLQRDSMDAAVDIIELMMTAQLFRHE